MSRLHLLILWILAIGAGFIFLKSKRDPSASASVTKLATGAPVFATNLIDTIDGFKIEKGDKTVTLKKVDRQWVVAEEANFPASLNTVTRMLDALRSTKVAQGVLASDTYYDRFNLDPTVQDSDESPDTITLMNEGKESEKLYLGNTRQATGGAGQTAGRFVRLESDDSGVYLTQQTFASIEGNPSNWIDKSFSPLEEGAIKLEISAPQDQAFKTWTISRKSVIDDFLVEGLSEKEETKTNETSTLKNILSGNTFSKLLTEEEAKKLSHEKGTREIKATDSAGSTFLITITPEKTAVKEADEKDPTNPAPAATPASNYITSIKILNGPTKPQTPTADASTQEKAVFEQRVANLADLSASVNTMRAKLEGRFFLLSKIGLASLLKSRGEFIRIKKVAKPKASVTTKPIQTPTTRAASATKPQSIVLPGQTPPPAIARPKETPPQKTKFQNTPPPIPGSQPAPPKKAAADKPE